MTVVRFDWDGIWVVRCLLEVKTAGRAPPPQSSRLLSRLLISRAHNHKLGESVLRTYTHWPSHLPR